MMKIFVIIMAKIIHPTLSPISVYYHYFHCLLTAHTNAPSQERQSPVGLECGSKQCSLTNILLILLVFINLPLTTLSLMNPLAQTSSHSYKSYDKDVQVGLMAIPRQVRKCHSPCAFWI